MCANEREELLRPGLSGGGGGKPFDWAATPTAGAAFANAGAAVIGFCAVLTVLTFATFAAFTSTLALVFACVFGSDLGAPFGASLTGVVVFITGFFVDFTFAAGLTTGLTAAFLTTFEPGLPTAFTAGVFAALFGSSLDNDTFFVGTDLEPALTAVLTALLTAFLATTAPFIFEPALAFATRATAFAFTEAFTTGLDASLGLGLDGFLAAFATGFAAALIAGLAANLDFLICAFTACLLWEAAPWFARA